MPGAGTDKTKQWVAGAGPVIVLVEPQLAENIGAVARAMGNFALSELRLVKPRDGWPNPGANRTASGADRILEEARLYETMAEAIADCSLVIAATARQHDQVKPVVGPEQAARDLYPHVEAGNRAALVFGRERNGLEVHEVGLADKILTLPVNPAFASLNLGQAVIICAYEFYKLASGNALPFQTPNFSPPAAKAKFEAFFSAVVNALEQHEFFRPPEKRENMIVNLRNIFLRLEPTEQDIQTLHGVIRTLAQGAKGPATGGILRGGEAELLRELLHRQGAATASGTAPGKGLARLLRRNPTEQERNLWRALTNDRRFAGQFKRNVPIGPHVTDFLAQALRLIIEVVPESEDAEAKALRAAKQAWLRERNYRIVEINSSERELDVLLSRIEEAMRGNLS
ncbi:MAG TPA: TrmJ/YjtD family RNA methyltransferase [Xanthobacteraceae bacterium]|nr:TrmJ/YjtD family RNA methyltransferase [Xanthobacteraceae bacterium]